MSTDRGIHDEKSNVKQVMARLNPTHYQEDMWEIALDMNVEELELLKKYGQELQFIVQYVYDNSKRVL